MIFIAGISIALFISALLLVKKNKSKSDVFLCLWMILNATHLTFFYLLYSTVIYDYPILLGLQFPLPLLHGVLLYYYVSSSTNQFPKNKFTVFLHLIPTIIVLLYIIPFVTLPPDQKIEVFKSKGKGYEIFQNILLFSVFFSGIFYVIWSNFLLRNHKKRIRSQFSNIEEISLKWLQFLTYGLGIIWSLAILSQNNILISTGVSVFVILIGFFGIQQKNIFSSQEKASSIIPSINSNDEVEQTKIRNLEDNQTYQNESEKYKSSGLSDEKALKYYEKLILAMKQEKVFTNPELSLSDLASKLDIHPNYLSQIINEKENKTFYDFINEYRIEEFKRLILLPENEQFTLMSIAFDCGFNSKSSFNRYFKKITEKTPSQYVKENKDN